MKNGILVARGDAEGKNIGDYVQSIAAREFAGADAVYVEREALDTYREGDVKVMMNAWFMTHPERFPPTDAIHPLFISFHLRPTVYDKFFTPAAIAYLKAHAPIGCRDLATVRELKRRGIEAEFTSCITLTLGERFKRKRPNGPPLIVDPYFLRLPKVKLRRRDIWRVIGVYLYSIPHFFTVRALVRKLKVFRYWPHNRERRYRWFYAAEFHRVYSPLFSDDFLLSAEYLTHKILKHGAGDEGLEKTAEAMLERYAGAPFVITSRLHCAFPCIAMGVPTVVPYHDKMSNGRFDGNIELMNRVDLGQDWRLVRPDWLKTGDGRIHSAADLPERNEWRAYAADLAARCRRFFATRGRGE